MKKISRCQSCEKSRRDAGIVLNSGTLPKSRTSVRQDAGMGQESRYGAVICPVGRDIGWIREKCDERLNKQDSHNVRRRGAGTGGWLRQVAGEIILNMWLDAEMFTE